MSNSEGTESKAFPSLDTIDILNLDTLTWASVEVMGVSPVCRYMHCAEGLGSTLVVFGGLTMGKH
jgi:hypothetical protein